MPRDEQVEFEQDRLGNRKARLDRLRAREGSVEGDEEGIVEITGGDTGNTVVVVDSPEHADRIHLTQVRLYGSAVTSGESATIYEVERDNQGSITSSTRRSVPLVATQDETTTYEYEGKEFEDDVAVESEFEGYVGVSFISDHDRSTETAEPQ